MRFAAVSCDVNTFPARTDDILFERSCSNTKGTIAAICAHWRGNAEKLFAVSIPGEAANPARKNETAAGLQPRPDLSAHEGLGVAEH